MEQMALHWSSPLVANVQRKGDCRDGLYWAAQLPAVPGDLRQALQTLSDDAG
jgi:hypothetical protein